MFHLLCSRSLETPNMTVNSKCGGGIWKNTNEVCAHLNSENTGTHIISNAKEIVHDHHLVVRWQYFNIPVCKTNRLSGINRINVSKKYNL